MVNFGEIYKAIKKDLPPIDPHIDAFRQIMFTLKGLEYERDLFYDKYNQLKAQRDRSPKAELQRQLRSKSEEITALENRLTEAESEKGKYLRQHEENLKKITAQKSQLERYQQDAGKRNWKYGFAGAGIAAAATLVLGLYLYSQKMPEMNETKISPSGLVETLESRAGGEILR